MMVYLDTSDLVKLYIDDPGAAIVAELVAQADTIATSVISYAEARSTFARRRRERRMTANELRSVVSHLDQDWRRFVVIQVTDDLGRAAGRLAEKHGIRGCDAVHLASFEHLLQQTDDDDMRFSCADERLTKAARNLG